MTDTVTVPREALELFDRAMRDADISFYHAARQTIHNLLAAAPKADPCDTHKVHGIHLDPCCPYCPDPEAPKVEQEPVAYVSRKGFTIGGLVWTDAGRDADLPDEAKLYTHPAPTSDELLEAAEYAVERFGMWKAPTANMEEALELLRDAIAKHKGPQ